jgi:hypothetical protein
MLPPPPGPIGRIDLPRALRDAPFEVRHVAVALVGNDHFAA